LWALTSLWFMRAFQTRSLVYAALAGLGAGAAMLGKYWSIVLIAGLATAALMDRRRSDFFRSGAPWVTVAVGFLVVAPHLGWLLADDFAPFGYAVEAHRANSLGGAAWGVLGYFAGAAGYVAIPVMLVIVLARPGWATLRDMILPRDEQRRLAVLVLCLPLVFGA